MKLMTGAIQRAEIEARRASAMPSASAGPAGWPRVHPGPPSAASDGRRRLRDAGPPWSISARISSAASLNRSSYSISTVRGRGRSIGMTLAIRPGRGVITTTRSASSTASGMLWVTNSTVLRRSSQIRSSSRPIVSRVIASSAANGSSISRISGSWISARQMPTRCCIPPLSSQACAFWKPSSPTFCQQLVGAARRARLTGSPSISIGSRTLSRTVRQGSRTGVWNTKPISRRGPVTGWPWMRTCPEVAASSPETSLRTVLLPQPDGPTRVTNSPSSTRRCRSSSAVTGPLAARAVDHRDAVKLDHRPRPSQGRATLPLLPHAACRRARARGEETCIRREDFPLAVGAGTA